MVQATVMPTKDRLLIIETSGQPGQVALAAGSVIIEARTLDGSRRHAQDLAPAVRGLLKETGTAPGDIAAVLVSSGPGSYTGIRVGMISAKAFAYATGCKVLAISTFHAIAMQISPDCLPVEIIEDAQQGHVYLQGYDMSSNDHTVKAVTPLAIKLATHWLEGHDPSTWIAGRGTRAYGDLLRSQRLVPECQSIPSSASILAAAASRLLNDEADDIYSIEPIYLRPSTAEQLWKLNEKTK
jgi:tRNA threonylcarbamoyladenosine biosynthesis protein TsaB